LRLLGTVGEPINPEAWLWYHRVIGDARCPIVDTWWQTETGGILITPLPGATPLKPGSATRPSSASGPPSSTAGSRGRGHRQSASSILAGSASIYGDHQRFIDTYFKTFPGKYFTGDGCRRDQDGYY
jgi:acetyl-CoA synthetase